MFNTGVPNKLSPFARKYQLFLNGTLKEKEASDKENFDIFIQKVMMDELEEGDKNPIEYGDMPYFNCELSSSSHSGGMNKLSFSTADDPFYKTSIGKYSTLVLIYS